MIDEYISWLYSIVNNENFSMESTYHQLFSYLYQRDFYYLIPLDGNRASDGIGLRYNFGRIFNYPDAAIASELDNKDCSVLEMMIALSLRCEKTIMINQDYGDRTSVWFWSMISSLGLLEMTDDNFDIYYVDNVITNFLDRHYKKDGHGGLFIISSKNVDLRNIEIWYQMNLFLNEYLGINN